MTDLTHHTSSTPLINRAIREAGIQHVTLHAGRGYQYLVYDDGADYGTRSEYVNTIRQLTVGDWIESARRLIDQMQEPYLVIGQCPRCYAINRHEPNCTKGAS